MSRTRKRRNLVGDDKLNQSKSHNQTQGYSREKE